MIVDYFNIVSIAVFPDKTYSELVIDPNCMLPRSVICQGMQLVARGDLQIAELCGRIEHLQLALG